MSEREKAVETNPYKQKLRELLTVGSNLRNVAITVMFDDADEYIRFIDYVYKHHDGCGLRLTNVPVLTSICVTPWLLEQTIDKFDMRVVTQQDLKPVLERIVRAKKPFDPEVIRGLRIPGT